MGLSFRRLVGGGLLREWRENTCLEECGENPEEQKNDESDQDERVLKERSNVLECAQEIHNSCRSMNRTAWSGREFFLPKVNRSWEKIKGKKGLGQVEAVHRPLLRSLVAPSSLSLLPKGEGDEPACGHEENFSPLRLQAKGGKALSSSFP